MATQYVIIVDNRALQPPLESKDAQFSQIFRPDWPFSGHELKTSVKACCGSYLLGNALWRCTNLAGVSTGC